MKTVSINNLAKAKSQTTRSTSSLIGQSSASRRVPTKMIFTFFKPNTETLSLKKDELMENLKGLGRGADASDDDKIRIDKLAAGLEKVNPTKNVLGPELSAKWKLLYTTSDAILGTSRPPFLRPFGDIFQTIDVENLTAKNQETAPFFNGVQAELSPVNKKTVNVQFKTFYILGLIPITAPESAKAELTITYLDDDLRISRGSKGNLFILSRSK